LDTVLLEDKRIKLWIYTDYDGNISKKPRNLYSLVRVRDEFIGLVQTFQPGGYTNVALILQNEDNATPVPVSLEDLTVMCDEGLSSDVVTIQIFIPARGNHAHFRTHR